MTNKIKILNIYKWATMGGVERVFLNRAHAFKENKLRVEYSVHFLHDSGGLKRFKSYIYKYELESHIQVVEHFDENDYDLILSVDTPEVLDLVHKKEKVFLECHTAYRENRSYLQRLPSDIKGVIVPSSILYSELKEEMPPHLSHLPIHRLNNFVIQHSDILINRNTVFSKIPLFYLGRLDHLKNVEEAVKILKEYQSKKGDDFVLVLAGPVIRNEVDINALIIKYGVLGRVVYLPPIDFENIEKVFEMISMHKGIFISCSTRETFGLSVAEAMLSGIPVLISNIPAHRELVNNDSCFLYELGNTNEAVDKLYEMLTGYDEKILKLKEYTSKFSYDSFVKDWNALKLLINF